MREHLAFEVLAGVSHGADERLLSELDLGHVDVVDLGLDADGRSCHP